MKNVIPDLMSATVFGPDDLAEMQQIFEEVCERREAHTREHRTAIATVIFSAYQAGERDRQKLVDVALAAAL